MMASPTKTSTREIVIRMEGKLDTVIEMTKEHEGDLNGNGKPGLKSDVRSLQQMMKVITGLAWGIGLPFVLAVFGFIWGIITHTITIGSK